MKARYIKERQYNCKNSSERQGDRQGRGGGGVKQIQKETLTKRDREREGGELHTYTERKTPFYISTNDDTVPHQSGDSDSGKINFE